MEFVSINSIEINEISVDNFNLLLFVAPYIHVSKNRNSLNKYFDHISALFPNIHKVILDQINISSYFKQHNNYKNIIIMVPYKNHIINCINLSNYGFDNVIQFSYILKNKHEIKESYLNTDIHINCDGVNNINSNFDTSHYLIPLAMHDIVCNTQVISRNGKKYKLIDDINSIFVDANGNFKKYKTTPNKILNMGDNFVIKNHDCFINNTQHYIKVFETCEFDKEIVIISPIAMAIKNDKNISYDNIVHEKLMMFLSYYIGISQLKYTEKFCNYFNIYDKSIRLCYDFSNAPICQKISIVDSLMDDTPLRFFVIILDSFETKQEYFDFIFINCKNNNSDPDFDDILYMIKVIKLNNLIYHNYQRYNDKLISLVKTKANLRSILDNILQFVFDNKAMFHNYTF